MGGIIINLKDYTTEELREELEKFFNIDLSDIDYENEEIWLKHRTEGGYWLIWTLQFA